MIDDRMICSPGRCHAYRGDLCQDNGYVIGDHNKTTMVLCDGAGAYALGGVAAQLIAKTVGRYMNENFKHFLNVNAEDAKFEMTLVINKTLTDYAEREGVSIRELATTVMAVTLAAESGEFVAFHLGDGVMEYNVNETWLRISSPVNGKKKNETCLTGNCSVLKNLNFYRWKGVSPALAILMKTDGMDEFSDREQREIIEGREELLSEKIHWDDCSYAFMRRV